MKVIVASLIGLWLCFFSPLLAQQELPPDVISTTKEEKPPHSPSVSTLYKDLDSLEVSNLLEKTSGLHVNRSGGFGQFSTVSIRGTSPGHTQLLWDGMPNHTDRQNTVNLAMIQANLVDSVDIHKGYIPLKYNASPIGGLIEFKSNINSENQGTRSLFNSSFGSYDYTQQYYSLEHSGKKDYVHFGVLFEKSKNDYPYLNDRGTKFNTSDDSIERKQNNEFQRVTMDIKLKQEVSNHLFSFTIRPMIGYNNIGGPQGVVLLSAKNSYFKTDSSFEHTLFLNSVEIKSQIYTLYGNHLLNDKLGEIGFSADIIKNKTFTTGFKNVLNYKTNEHIEWNLLNSLKNTRFSEINILKTGKKNWSQEQYDGGLELATNWNKLYFSVQTKWTQISYDTNQRDVEANDWSHQAMLRYDINNFIDAMISVGKSNRYPTLSELFGDSGLEIGNQNLQPENALSYSLDCKGSYAVGVFQLVYGSSIFYKEIENLIHYENVGAGLARPVNANKAEIYGFELSLNMVLTKFYSLNMHYTNQKPLNKSTGIYYNNTIPGHPESSFYMNHVFTWKTLSIDFSLHHIENEYLDQANIRKNKSKLLMNVGLAFKKENFTVRAELQNITDKQYEDFFNYPLPGRYFLVQSQFTF